MNSTMSNGTLKSVENNADINVENNQLQGKRQRIAWYTFLIVGLCVALTDQSIFGDNFMLNTLYFSKPGALMRAILTKPWFSKLAGIYCDMRLSKIHIKPFIKKHQVNTEEIADPIDSCTCFNDFFTRKLKTSARPIAQDEGSIASPVDGLVHCTTNISRKTKFTVKGTSFDLENFLKNPSLADYFYGGTLMVFYLSPVDYHRFHFPCAAMATKPAAIKGAFESVNPIVYKSHVQPLTQNERHLILLTDAGDNKIAYIPVGALCVGRITETYQPGKLYDKGDEAGYFSFGGSTLVLIFPKGTVELDESLPEGVFLQVKMGMKIGTFLS